MEFESLIHTEFKKQRAKPPAAKRNIEEVKRQEESGLPLSFSKQNEELSLAAKLDFTKYLEAFVLFTEKVKDADELFDMVEKVSEICRDALIANKPEIISEFVRHLVDGFERGASKLYLLKILNTLFEQAKNAMLEEENFAKNRAQDADKSRPVGRSQVEILEYLSRVQNIMHKEGVTQMCLKLISLEEESNLAYEAVKLLTNLLSFSNTHV